MAEGLDGRGASGRSGRGASGRGARGRGASGRGASGRGVRSRRTEVAWPVVASGAPPSPLSQQRYIEVPALCAPDTHVQPASVTAKRQYRQQRNGKRTSPRRRSARPQTEANISNSPDESQVQERQNMIVPARIRTFVFTLRTFMHIKGTAPPNIRFELR